MKRGGSKLGLIFTSHIYKWIEIIFSEVWHDRSEDMDQEIRVIVWRHLQTSPWRGLVPNLIIDVWREGEVRDVSSHSLNNFELSFVNDNSTVGQNKFRNSVNGHPLKDVEIHGVVVGCCRDGPWKSKIDFLLMTKQFDVERKRHGCWCYMEANLEV